jgi:ferritin-like metal-binding protein YciE
VATVTDPDLLHWLRDLHAVEHQAIVHLRSARKLVDDPGLARDLEQHLTETIDHRERLRVELARRGGTGSRPKDLAATANRLGFLLYTAIGSDALGKMLVDSLAYEYLEVAAYRMLAEVARISGEGDLRELAGQIGAEERKMADRLRNYLDGAVSDSRGRFSCQAALRLHLRDVHALETQTTVLLALAARVVGEPLVRRYCREQLQVTGVQRRRLRQRLREAGDSPSFVRSGAMALAGAAWAAVWTAQRYTTAKLTCFIYAERHLQASSYDLLAREGAACGDTRMSEFGLELFREESDAAAQLDRLLEPAARYTAAQGA